MRFIFIKCISLISNHLFINKIKLNLHILLTLIFYDFRVVINKNKTMKGVIIGCCEKEGKE